jgi:hypothetical protein
VTRNSSFQSQFETRAACCDLSHGACHPLLAGKVRPRPTPGRAFCGRLAEFERLSRPSPPGSGYRVWPGAFGRNGLASAPRRFFLRYRTRPFGLGIGNIIDCCTRHTRLGRDCGSCCGSSDFNAGGTPHSGGRGAGTQNRRRFCIHDITFALDWCIRRQCRRRSRWFSPR